jgi:hypothetical protein
MAKTPEQIREFMKDAQGRYRTESLFYETSRDRIKYPPLFTLKEHDHKACLSMYALYMEIADPSEYYFAKQVLGSYAHWEKLVTLAWFKDHLEMWRVHLESKLRGKAIRTMVEESNKGSEVAAKWIANRGWEHKTAPVRGRPSKEEVQAALQKRTDQFEQLESDAARVGLK